MIESKWGRQLRIALDGIKKWDGIIDMRCYRGCLGTGGGQSTADLWDLVAAWDLVGIDSSPGLSA